MAVRRITTGLQVTGLQESIAAAVAARDEWGDQFLKEVRAEIRPMSSDIRKRFKALGGTGDRVASTVRYSVTSKGAKISFGNAKHPYSLGREFGAKRNQTRPHSRKVQSGRTITRSVGGGASRQFVAKIPYSSPPIFDGWTGNQFQLGEAAGRLTIEQESGRAFYPGVGAGMQHLYDRLGKAAERTAESFPDQYGKAQRAIRANTAIGRLQNFLEEGGL